MPNRLKAVATIVFPPAVLTAIALWAVYPLLEEWGMYRAFNAQGLGYIWELARQIPMRPFHLIPYAVHWISGGGNPAGVGIGTAIFLLMRYFVTYWAVTPFLKGNARLLAATLAATLLAWPGAWYGRYAAAQASAILFFLALGFSVRFLRAPSWRSTAGCIVSVFLLLCTYQALAICLLAIPLVATSWPAPPAVASGAVNSRLSNAGRTAIPIASGFLLYAIYAVTCKLILGSLGYEESLASDASRLLSVPGAVTHIKAVYATAYFNTVYVFPLLLAFFLLVHRDGLRRTGEPGRALSSAAAAILLVGALPLMSLVFVNEAHMRDLDRVLFPLSVGFVLVMATASFHLVGRGLEEIHPGTAASAIGLLLIAAFLTAANGRENGLIQASVLKQTLPILSKTGPRSVLLRDETGKLGDVYTLYQIAFELALVVSGADVKAMICTPRGVDRLHDVARRFPIPSTPRCEELQDGGAGELVLSARWENGVIRIDEAARRLP